jgi:hypothetical protein
MAKTNDAIEIINSRYIKNDPALQDLLRAASLNAKVAQLTDTTTISRINPDKTIGNCQIRRC